MEGGRRGRGTGDAWSLNLGRGGRGEGVVIIIHNFEKATVFLLLISVNDQKSFVHSLGGAYKMKFSSIERMWNAILISFKFLRILRFHVKQRSQHVSCLTSLTSRENCHSNRSLFVPILIFYKWSSFVRSDVVSTGIQ